MPAFRAGRMTNCIPAFRPRLCLCRRNPADYPRDEARHGRCADISACARPAGDAVPLTSCRQTNPS
ncbi:hypothetical protein F7R13_12580 [Burkholderia territorii]|uniref:Uncharacterized protein n=1 Tax=Burkholderia territorii TaxID=1503055 RepID=A0A6L3NH51_9BURK|nr:hypothetical protein F7R13_12580 [Burkholderia territorii]